MGTTPPVRSASLAGRCPHSPTGPTTATPHQPSKGGRPPRPHSQLREPHLTTAHRSHFHLLDNGRRAAKDVKCRAEAAIPAENAAKHGPSSGRIGYHPPIVCSGLVVVPRSRGGAPRAAGA